MKIRSLFAFSTTVKILNDNKRQRSDLCIKQLTFLLPSTENKTVALVIFFNDVVFYPRQDKEAELQIHTQRHKREAEELQLRINVCFPLFFTFLFFCFVLP